MAKRVGVDKWLFFTTLMLVVTGLVMVFSASAVVGAEKYHSAYAFILTQSVWAAFGLVALIVLMKIDVGRYNSPRFIYPVLGLALALLVLVFFMPGSHHTHRWIRFGSFFSFQPSEIAKPALALFLAWFLHDRLGLIRDGHVLLRAASIPLLLVVMVVCQNDLGTALVLVGVTAMVLVFAGMEWKYLVGAFCAVVPAVLALILLSPWRRDRLLTYLHPAAHSPAGSRAAFHINQSLIAVGTGGLTGRGYMEGMQKLFYLPESSTDFIFANIAEELGFLGAMLIVALFVVFGVRGLRAAYRARDPFSKMLAFGLTVAILLQAFFNISVVLALVPTKGITLPLISHGGTSLFCTLASIGILLNISRQAE